jgi:hypothetical protein
MLDQDFCRFLEHKLEEAFGNSEREGVRHFWCDGVSLPDSEADYSKKSVNDNRQVVMTAYTGISGQDIYQLTLIFGRKALSRFARDLDISVCFPDSDSEGWWDVDVERRTIWIQLD